MARSTAARASDSPRDAIALLKQDHRTVESLFEEFERTDEEAGQGSIADRICQLLTVHAQIEEELLYPAAKQALEDEEDSELVEEAEVEHATAKDLIAKIEGMSPQEEQYKATVKVLGEYVKHHVKEEETQLFSKLRKTDVDLKEMGAQLADRKFALMEQMGIEAEEPPAARRRASGTRASTSRSRQARAAGRKASGGRTARH